MGETQRKNYIITGCSSGIGLATLKSMVTDHASEIGTIVMACRSRDKLADAIDTLKLGNWDKERCSIPVKSDSLNVETKDQQQEQEKTHDDQLGEAKIHSQAEGQEKSILDRLIFIPCELSDPASVGKFAEAFLNMEISLDVLILNAGVVSSQTVFMFETNVVGHYHLTRLLLPKVVEAKGKIIVVSSEAHSFATKLKDNQTIRDHIYSTGNSGLSSVMWEYGFTKLCNIWFSMELHKRYNSLGLRANALHPGTVKTNLGMSDVPWILKPAVRTLTLFFSTPDDGARTTLLLAFSSKFEHESGKYFSKGKIGNLRATGNLEERWTELWDLCEALCKEKLGDFEYPKVE